jgi:hypothetical protein
MKLTNILVELIEEGVITDKKIIGYIYELQEELEDGAKEKFKKFVIASLIAGGLWGLGANVVRDNAFKNILPYEYNKADIGFFQRFKEAILDNKQEALRVGLDSNYFNGYDQEKLDLWGMYLRQHRDHKSIIKADYTPENGEDAEWYKVPKLERDLKGDIGNHLNNCSSFQEFKIRLIKLVEDGIILGNVKTDTSSGRATVSIQPLGNATLAAGQDEKGFFISYIDSWDINPFKGGSKIDPYSLGKIPGDIITKLGIDKMEDISLGIGKPIKVYGKIYFSKKGSFVKSVRNPRRTKRRIF